LFDCFAGNQNTTITTADRIVESDDAFSAAWLVKGQALFADSFEDSEKEIR